MTTRVEWTHEGEHNEWCVVEAAGEQAERIVMSFRTFDMAAKYVTNRRAGRLLDVMRLTEKGNLTTEY